MNKKHIIKEIETLRTLIVDPDSAYALRVKVLRYTIKLLRRVFLNF